MSMHPPHDPDELASDLVDGLLPVDDAARLRTDPAIAARVEAIETLRAALRVAPPTAEGDVDRALAATFAALDHGSLPGSGSASGPGSEPASGERPPPPITHLRSAAPARAVAHRRSNGKPWLAAAAAIALLGLVTIGVLSNQGSDDGDHATDAAASAPDLNADAQAEAGGGGADAGAGAESSDGDGAVAGEVTQPTPPAVDTPEDQAAPSATSAPGTSALTNLGAVGSAGELADRVRGDAGPLTAMDGGSDVLASPGDEGTQGRNQCAALTAAGDTDRGEAKYVADAVFKGNPVRVHLYDDGTGKLRLVATDASCADVVDTPYQP
ncbi:MAG TPA: hypothetical protein VGO78_01140 [Acidimicrobiales bacterium]|nr:hypothetical protein [Acidimicrobiales bacterium]